MINEDRALLTRRDGQVNQTELRMAMAACATGFCRLHGIKPPPDDTLHSLAGEAFLHHVCNSIPSPQGASLRAVFFRGKPLVNDFPVPPKLERLRCAW